MKKQSLLTGIVGLILGAAIAWAATVLAVNNNNIGMMNAMGVHPKATVQTTSNSDDMSMNQMMNNLKGKTGDDFDKTFISEMVMHHQSAIDMATLAKQNAKHDEIKTMASDIVDAQTKEISQMQMWQMEWGYADSSTDHDMTNMNR